MKLKQDSTGALIDMSYGGNGTGLGLKIKEVLVDLGAEITGSETFHDVSGFFPALAIPIAFSIRVTEAMEAAKHITKIGTDGIADLIAGGDPDGVLANGMLDELNDLLTMPIGASPFAGAMASIMGVNAAATLRITVAAANPSTGIVRCVLYYWDITPPTS
tara:strand:- start:127 stop:609 length:483 start_codon:yes stop_codon:yes gene_type:complete